MLTWKILYIQKGTLFHEPQTRKGIKVTCRKAVATNTNTNRLYRQNRENMAQAPANATGAMLSNASILAKMHDEH